MVAVLAAAVVAAPYVGRAVPVPDADLSPAQVVAAVESSAAVEHSGYVESDGAIQVPQADTFEGIATLLGERNRVRVYWRGADDWRVDRVRATGETDIFHRPEGTLRWVYESGNATVTRAAPVRLPDTSDVLPGQLARRVLDGATASELSALAPRRVAGLEAVGVRLRPSDAQASIDRADVWADPDTGLPLRVDVYAAGETRPSLSSRYADVDLTAPAASTTSFDPPPGTDVRFDETIDVADASNTFAPYRAPDELAGLQAREGRPELPTRAVGVYGRGPTVLLFIPLRGRAAEPLREQLARTPGVRETASGTGVDLGPLSILVTPERRRGSGFLLAGTVTPQTLDRAAAEVADLRARFS